VHYGLMYVKVDWLCYKRSDRLLKTALSILWKMSFRSELCTKKELLDVRLHYLHRNYNHQQQKQHQEPSKCHHHPGRRQL